MRSDGAKDDLAAGKAGEYLVCADLILKGFVAFPSEQGLPYDVVTDINGRLYKVQVKATRGLRNVPQRANDASGYIFHIGRCGKGGVKSYSDDDVDLFALVALDTRTIGYLPARDAKRSMMFRAPQNEGKHYDEVIAARRDAIRAAKAAGLSNAEIAKQFGMNQSVVGRVFKDITLKTRASPYLHEMTLERIFQSANDNNPEVFRHEA